MVVNVKGKVNILTCVFVSALWCSLPQLGVIQYRLLDTHYQSTRTCIRHQVFESTNVMGMITTFCGCVTGKTGLPYHALDVQTSDIRELTCIIVLIIDIVSLGWRGPLHSKR
jgi:hypothetical protein